MAGVDAVSRGAASSAFCAIRPPGHHALPAKAMGFCIFNNVVLAVRHALTVHGVARTAVLDFDAHHGNGTEALLRNDSRVVLGQTFQTDFFPFTGEVADEPRRVNVPLAAGAGGGDFRDAVEKRWLPALRDFRPELILVSAGFDAHSEDPLSGLEFSDSDYAWIGEIVANEARAFDAKVVSVLEGGYDLKALERSVDGYLRGMAGV
jgi:acetoin utilization deacetylase AcuC-like enzyme